MTDNTKPVPDSPARSAKHRLAILASVATLGLAVGLAGPSAFKENFPTVAHAAESTATLQPSGFADIVAKVKPAVISVRVKIDELASFNGGDEELDPGSPMQKFFKRFGLPEFDGRPMPQQHHMMTGQGSGFFISADGYAVTNNHVVDHAKSVVVTTDDGKTYDAKVIGRDAKTDLALIKVDGHKDFPFVRFADKAPRIGDWVLAVGNPFGLSETVTAGIVSASGRNIGAGPYDDFIQIDAPINKGNSGGPSFDVEGNVVGVNTAIFSPSGGSVGIGFAIPAETAKLVINQLKESGHVTRGWMGVQIQQITPEIADSMGLKSVAGALVAEPQPNSPAAKAGIKAGDVITAVNGQEVKTPSDLARKIAEMAPQSKVTLTLIRNGATQEQTLTLGTMSANQQAKAGSSTDEEGTDVPHLGLSLAPGSAEGADQGVVVTGVEPNGPAADQGFKSGDLILEVAGKKVSTPNDVTKAVHEAKGGGKHAVLMRVKSGDQTRFVALPFGKTQG
jgi:serine protease Do